VVQFGRHLLVQHALGRSLHLLTVTYQLFVDHYAVLYYPRGNVGAKGWKGRDFLCIGNGLHDRPMKKMPILNKTIFAFFQPFFRSIVVLAGNMLHYLLMALPVLNTLLSQQNQWFSTSGKQC